MVAFLCPRKLVCRWSLRASTVAFLPHTCTHFLFLMLKGNFKNYCWFVVRENYYWLADGWWLVFIWCERKILLVGWRSIQKHSEKKKERPVPQFEPRPPVRAYVLLWFTVFSLTQEWFFCWSVSRPELNQFFFFLWSCMYPTSSPRFSNVRNGWYFSRCDF